MNIRKIKAYVRRNRNTTAVTTAFIKYVIDLGVHINNQTKTVINLSVELYITYTLSNLTNTDTCVPYILFAVLMIRPHQAC